LGGHFFILSDPKSTSPQLAKWYWLMQKQRQFFFYTGLIGQFVPFNHRIEHCLPRPRQGGRCDIKENHLPGKSNGLATQLQNLLLSF